MVYHAPAGPARTSRPGDFPTGIPEPKRGDAAWGKRTAGAAGHGPACGFGGAAGQDAEAEGVGSGLVGGGSGAGLGGGVVGGGVVGGGVVGGGVVGGGWASSTWAAGWAPGSLTSAAGWGRAAATRASADSAAWPVLPGDAVGSTPTGVGPSSPGSGPSAAWCEWVFLVSVGRTAAGERGAGVGLRRGLHPRGRHHDRGSGQGTTAAMTWTSIVPGTMSTAIATDGATTLRDMLRRIPDLLLPVLPFTERLAALAAVRAERARGPGDPQPEVDRRARERDGGDQLGAELPVPAPLDAAGARRDVLDDTLAHLRRQQRLRVIPGDRVGLQDLARRPAWRAAPRWPSPTPGTARPRRTAAPARGGG